MADSAIRLTGLAEVQRALNAEIKRIQGYSLQGLIRAAAMIRTDMEHTPPLIPVDTGNLRQSWTVVPIPIANRPTILLGFTAGYAVWVHENIGAHFQRPGAGAKFFEAALLRNQHKILEIIQQGCVR